MMTRYTHYLEALEGIKQATKWSLTDDFRRLMAIHYAIHDTPFDQDRFEQAQTALKQKTGMFSKFRGTNSLVWLSFLDAKYEDVASAIDEALRLDQLLDRKHFRHSMLRPFIASQLLSINDPERRLDEATALYQTFKQHHPWLTSEEDLLSALVLVQALEDHDDLNARIEAYYETLQVHVSRSNELQLVSHLLAFSELAPTEAVSRFLTWRDQLQQQNINVRNEHLPSLALLTIVTDPTNTTVQNVADIVRAETEKQRWFNRHSLTVALQLVAVDTITEEASELLLHGTFAHLLAMQQAATAAATVAIISRTSSSD